MRHHQGVSLYSQVIDFVFSVAFLFLPESQVLLEKLNDALCVAEFILLQRVDLVESLSESLVSKFTRRRVVIHHLVMEHGEVQSKAQFDWVARG